MVKNTKAHINLASPGEHDFLASVSFEHGQSECLRIQEIRLRPSSGEKPYKLPLNLLTWFTEHAPAGRELTRDDNNQKNEAALFVNLLALKEQIETFALKDTFLLEIEINELDQNDESRVRTDQGIMHIQVTLYHGPKANCTLEIEPLSKTLGKSLYFPINCSAEGRFDLAKATLKSNQGPLDPNSDKRVLLCNVKLPEKWQALRNSIIERLSFYEGTREQPGQYIEDAHHYAENYAAFPHDQHMSFPKGVQLFGPFMPSAPKEKKGPWTISLSAPLNDPFWQELAEFRGQNNNEPLKGKIELILPEPGQNITCELDFSIQFDEEDWIILNDAAAMAAPVLLPVNRTRSLIEESETAGELILFCPEASLPSSQFLSIQYYGFGLSEGPVNVSLTPAKQDANFYTVKPEVSEITNYERNLLLLNRIALNKKLKIQKSEYKLKCFWPDKQQTESFKISIRLLEKSYSQFLAIDIGSKAISASALNQTTISSIPLGKYAPDHFISSNFIASTLTLSGRRKAQPKTTDESETEEEDKKLDEQNWRAKIHPLSISYTTLPWQENAIQQRLATQNRHYDIALPATVSETPDDNLRTPDDNFGTKVNLKRLFSQVMSSNQTTTQEEAGYLLATRRKITEQGENQQNGHFETGLISTLDPSWLMADCLDELYNFYGCYLFKSCNNNPEHQKPRAGKQQRSAELVLTHTGRLSSHGSNRFKFAGATALAHYEQGSFANLGKAAELIGLPDKEQLSKKVHLVNETLAAGYHALKKLAEQEQPARCKKIQQIHMDIGAAHVSLLTQSSWLGETNIYLEKVHSTIDLPLGASALELVLTKEISFYIETAIQASAQIIKQTELPKTTDEIVSAAEKGGQVNHAHHKYLTSLRSALYNLHNNKNQQGHDFHICLGQSQESDNWPLALAATAQPAGETHILWNGLRGEQLVYVSNDDGEEWRIELHLESESLAQKVGPLTTYLAFVAEFLPRAIAHNFPKAEGSIERIFSVSGGTSLFPPLQKLIKSTVKKLGYRLLPLPNDYLEAKSSTALGALEMIQYQEKPPHHNSEPSLMLIPLEQKENAEHSTEEEDMFDVAAKGDLVIIESVNAAGTLPKNCITLQLVETIPGFGALLKGEPKALYCQTYLDDMDRATKEQWHLASAQWQVYLDQCYQIMLNMPVADQADATTWAYQSLKIDEAQLTIGNQAYWVSSGLSGTNH